MAPKNKNAGGKKGKGGGGDEGAPPAKLKGGLKAANAINVRHILVRHIIILPRK